MIRKSPSATPVNTIRCAIYTRKSTEEGLNQDFNSLDAQRESAEAYVQSQQHEGWTYLAERYDDGGFSGGNVERPALQRLMADIEAQKIDCVVVYKVDRLSRSLLDFSRLMEIFDRHGVSFVSVTQQFSTTNSMGRLTLNILLSFAQFEREIISERTRDKMAAARRKGKWSGGSPLLGYDVVDRRLVVNEGEAKQVRAIFGLYLKHRGLLPVVQELERRDWTQKQHVTRAGITRGGLPFTRTSVHSLLTNVTYVGKVCYQKELYTGEQAALIDPATWQAVQDLLSENRNANVVPRSASGALLKGFLRCSPCNSAMVPSHATRGGRRYRYYRCNQGVRRGREHCPSGALPAAQLEALVWEQVLLAELPADLKTALESAVNPHDQTELLTRLVERIDYDGRTKTIAIHFRPSDDAQNIPPIEFPVYFSRGRRSGKQLSSAPAVPSNPESGRVPRVARFMALALRIERLVREGQIKDYAEAARLGHVTRARLSQIMNLLQLAPDLQEAVLFLPRVERGRSPLHLAHLQPITGQLEWPKQRLFWKRLLKRLDLVLPAK